MTSMAVYHELFQAETRLVPIRPFWFVCFILRQFYQVRETSMFFLLELGLQWAWPVCCKMSQRRQTIFFAEGDFYENVQATDDGVQLIRCFSHGLFKLSRSEEAQIQLQQ
ncbi:MAG: hypothetical protein C5B49_08440 [Bdellovibrio sp.]|nr:MAG: hypothetical protein C5B49_08440 [Bdellovibrio sp.]